MEHAITLGDVLIASAVVAGVICIGVGVIWFLTILAKGMSR